MTTFSTSKVFFFDNLPFTCIESDMILNSPNLVVCVVRTQILSPQIENDSSLHWWGQRRISISSRKGKWKGRRVSRTILLVRIENMSIFRSLFRVRYWQLMVLRRSNLCGRFSGHQQTEKTFLVSVVFLTEFVAKR